jgi:hypothetical protein
LKFSYFSLYRFGYPVVNTYLSPDYRLVSDWSIGL